MNRPQIAFEGTKEALRLLGPAPAALAVGGRGRLALSAISRDGRSELRMAWRPELAREEPAAPPGDVTLLRGFERLELAYFGGDRPSDPTAWHDTWTERPSLPELVRLRIKFPDGDRRSWPELIVAPQLMVDANCLYDPLLPTPWHFDSALRRSKPIFCPRTS